VALSFHTDEDCEQALGIEKSTPQRHGKTMLEGGFAFGTGDAILLAVYVVNYILCFQISWCAKAHICCGGELNASVFHLFLNLVCCLNDGEFLCHVVVLF
jgi:hypothetical protein